MDLRKGIQATADRLQIDPLDLATIISYETAGTFDPTKRGPTTQWGQHRGLIQFGEPQARQYGVNWDDPLGSQLGPDGAIARYFQDNGAQPGMGLLDLYSIVNAGGPGLYDRSDANNGGAPGTVRDKVRNQMGGHRRNALALFDIANAPPGYLDGPPKGAAPGPMGPRPTGMNPPSPKNRNALAMMADKPPAEGPRRNALAMMDPRAFMNRRRRMPLRLNDPSRPGRTL